MTLKITIADAMLQHKTQMSSQLMKPYVIIHTGDSEYKTRASSGTNPTWGDTILVSTREEDLTLEVFDMDQGIDDTIGHAFVKVRSLIGQPYVPQESVITLGYKNMFAGELRLIVEYIEGKEHIGGVAPFQSKLMMGGQQPPQPPIQPQYPPQQFAVPQSNLQVGIMQSGMMDSQRRGGFQDANSNIFANQAASGFQQFQPQPGSIIVQEQTIYQNQGMPTPSQIVDHQSTFFNPRPPSQQMLTSQRSAQQDPLMFNTYNPQTNPTMRTSQLGPGAGNLTIVGGTPSTINQAFGSRRMPIFKSGCPNLNWFSILDGQNKPSQCMPPRLI